jgi:ABC-type protease/lipase transport system fused ATPase/permease subunit
VSLREYVTEGSKRGIRAARLAEDVFLATDAVEGMKFSGPAVARWAGEAEAQAAYSRATNARNSVWTSIVRTLRISLQVLTLAAAAWLVLEGQLTSGAMIAASIIGARALAPIDQAVASWRLVSAARVSWQRLGQLTAGSNFVEPDKTEPPPTRGALEAEAVSVRAENGQVILNAASIRVPPGAFVGLVGPSGSGKTTLSRVLAGARPADAGIVRLDGMDIINWPTARLGKAIGYMPQSMQLLGGTIAENIRRFGPKDDEGVLAAANLAGANALIAAMPHGYDTDVGDGGSALSGGQRALVGLARAVYGSPNIVILDEPAASLDTAGRASLGQCLQQLRARKTTVILVSHDPGSLRQFDAIVEMGGGKILRSGKPSEMLKPAPVPNPAAQPVQAAAASLPAPQAAAAADAPGGAQTGNAT